MGDSRKIMQVRSARQMPVRVILLDDELFEDSVDKRAIGFILFDKVCEHLNLLEKDYFGLSYRDALGTKNWLNNEKKIAKQLKGTNWDLMFEVKFYSPEPSQLAEDITRYQLCLQIRRDIVNEKLPCSFLTYTLLGSYTAQSELGDYDTEEFGSGYKYLKDLKFAPHQDKELLQKIAELHRQHKGQTPEEAELHFLENAVRLSMYGVELHQAKDAEASDITLGVAAAGLIVYKDNMQMNRFVWPKVLKMSYRRNKFYIKIRPGEFEDFASLIGFKLLNVKMAKRLWKIAVEHHSFFRFREPDQPKHTGLMPRLSSRFHYSGRTQYQTKQIAAMENRDSPAFDRVMSKRGTFAGRTKNMRKRDDDRQLRRDDMRKQPISPDSKSPPIVDRPREDRKPSPPEPKHPPPELKHAPPVAPKPSKPKASPREPSSENASLDRSFESFEDVPDRRSKMERMHGVATPLAAVHRDKERSMELERSFDRERSIDREREDNHYDDDDEDDRHRHQVGKTEPIRGRRFRAGSENRHKQGVHRNMSSHEQTRNRDRLLFSYPSSSIDSVLSSEFDEYDGEKGLDYNRSRSVDALIAGQGHNFTNPELSYRCSFEDISSNVNQSSQSKQSRSDGKYAEIDDVKKEIHEHYGKKGKTSGSVETEIKPVYGLKRIPFSKDNVKQGWQSHEIKSLSSDKSPSSDNTMPKSNITPTSRSQSEQMPAYATINKNLKKESQSVSNVDKNKLSTSFDSNTLDDSITSSFKDELKMYILNPDQIKAKPSEKKETAISHIPLLENKMSVDTGSENRQNSKKHTTLSLTPLLEDKMFVGTESENRQKRKEHTTFSHMPLLEDKMSVGTESENRQKRKEHTSKTRARISSRQTECEASNELVSGVDLSSPKTEIKKTSNTEHLDRENRRNGMGPMDLLYDESIQVPDKVSMESDYFTSTKTVPENLETDIDDFTSSKVSLCDTQLNGSDSNLYGETYKGKGHFLPGKNLKFVDSSPSDHVIKRKGETTDARLADAPLNQPTNKVSNQKTDIPTSNVTSDCKAESHIYENLPVRGKRNFAKDMHSYDSSQDLIKAVDKQFDLNVQKKVLDGGDVDEISSDSMCSVSLEGNMSELKQHSDMVLASGSSSSLYKIVFDGSSVGSPEDSNNVSFSNSFSSLGISDISKNNHLVVDDDELEQFSTLSSGSSETNVNHPVANPSMNNSFEKPKQKPLSIEGNESHEKITVKHLVGTANRFTESTDEPLSQNVKEDPNDVEKVKIEEEAFISRSKRSSLNSVSKGNKATFVHPVKKETTFSEVHTSQDDKSPLSGNKDLSKPFDNNIVQKQKEKRLTKVKAFQIEDYNDEPFRRRTPSSVSTSGSVKDIPLQDEERMDFFTSPENVHDLHDEVLKTESKEKGTKHNEKVHTVHTSSTLPKQTECNKKIAETSRFGKNASKQKNETEYHLSDKKKNTSASSDLTRPEKYDKPDGSTISSKDPTWYKTHLLPSASKQELAETLLENKIETAIQPTKTEFVSSEVVLDMNNQSKSADSTVKESDSKKKGTKQNEHSSNLSESHPKVHISSTLPKQTECNKKDDDTSSFGNNASEQRNETEYHLSDEEQNKSVSSDMTRPEKGKYDKPDGSTILSKDPTWYKTHLLSSAPKQELAETVLEGKIESAIQPTKETTFVSSEVVLDINEGSKSYDSKIKETDSKEKYTKQNENSSNLSESHPKVHISSILPKRTDCSKKDDDTSSFGNSASKQKNETEYHLSDKKKNKSMPSDVTRSEQGNYDKPDESTTSSKDPTWYKTHLLPSTPKQKVVETLLENKIESAIQPTKEIKFVAKENVTKASKAATAVAAVYAASGKSNKNSTMKLTGKVTANPFKPIPGKETDIDSILSGPDSEQQQYTKPRTDPVGSKQLLSKPSVPIISDSKVYVKHKPTKDKEQKPDVGNKTDVNIPKDVCNQANKIISGNLKPHFRSLDQPLKSNIKVQEKDQITSNETSFESSTTLSNAAVAKPKKPNEARKQKVSPGVVHIINPCPSGWIEGGIKDETTHKKQMSLQEKSKTNTVAENLPFPDKIKVEHKSQISSLGFDMTSGTTVSKIGDSGDVKGTDINSEAQKDKIVLVSPKVSDDKQLNESSENILSTAPKVELLCKRVWTHTKRPKTTNVKINDDSDKDFTDAICRGPDEADFRYSYSGPASSENQDTTTKSGGSRNRSVSSGKANESSDKETLAKEVKSHEYLDVKLLDNKPDPIVMSVAEDSMNNTLSFSLDDQNQVKNKKEDGNRISKVSASPFVKNIQKTQASAVIDTNPGSSYNNIVVCVEPHKPESVISSKLNDDEYHHEKVSDYDECKDEDEESSSNTSSGTHTDSDSSQEIELASFEMPEKNAQIAPVPDLKDNRAFDDKYTENKPEPLSSRYKKVDSYHESWGLDNEVTAFAIDCSFEDVETYKIVQKKDEHVHDAKQSILCECNFNEKVGKGYPMGGSSYDTDIDYALAGHYSEASQDHINRVPVIIDETPYKPLRSNLKCKFKSEPCLFDKRVHFQENLPVYKSSENIRTTPYSGITVEDSEATKLDYMQKFIHSLFDIEPKNLGLSRKDRFMEPSPSFDDDYSSDTVIPQQELNIGLVNPTGYKTHVSNPESSNENMTVLVNTEPSFTAMSATDDFQSDPGERAVEDQHLPSVSSSIRRFNQGNNMTVVSDDLDVPPRPSLPAKYHPRIAKPVTGRPQRHVPEEMSTSDIFKVEDKNVSHCAWPSEAGTATDLRPQLDESLERRASLNQISSILTRMSDENDPSGNETVHSAFCEAELIPEASRSKFTMAKQKESVNYVHDQTMRLSDGSYSDSRKDEHVKFKECKDTSEREQMSNKHSNTSSPDGKIMRYTYAYNDDADLDSPKIKSVTYEYVTEYKLNNVKVNYKQNQKVQTDQDPKYKGKIDSVDNVKTPRPKVKMSDAKVQVSIEKHESQIIPVEEIIEKSVCYPLGPINNVPVTHSSKLSGNIEETTVRSMTNRTFHQRQDYKGFKVSRASNNDDVQSTANSFQSIQSIPKSKFVIGSAKTDLGMNQLSTHSDKLKKRYPQSVGKGYLNKKVIEHNSEKYVWQSFKIDSAGPTWKKKTTVTSLPDSPGTESKKHWTLLDDVDGDCEFEEYRLKKTSDQTAATEPVNVKCNQDPAEHDTIVKSDNNMYSALMAERLPDVSVAESTNETMFIVQAMAVVALGTVLVFLLPYAG